MISSLPNSLTARATAVRTSVSLATSVFWKTALPPFSPHSRTTAAPPSSFRSAITTAAPSPAKRMAVPRPIPLAAPVITATLFSSLPIGLAPSQLFASHSQFLKQRFRILQIGGVEALAEPVVDVGEHRACFVGAIGVALSGNCL